MEAKHETEEPSSVPAEKHVVKSPPCDQCRRRKVKCDSESPCDRCTQSGLRCTRDIARKRRGPKKGSGSVIAKLRDETDQSLLANVTLPQYDLPPLSAGNGLSGPYKMPSGENIFPSASSNYGATFAPRSYPVGPNLTSVPFSGQGPPDIGLPPVASQYATPATEIDSPLPWRLADSSTRSQYSSPGSPGYLTVNELAHKIFDDTDPSSLAYQFMGNNEGMTAPEVFSQAQNAPIGPASIDAILSAASDGARSTSPHSTSSPGSHNPQYMPPRNPGNPAQVEVQIASVAAEIGVSPTLMSQCVKQYFLHLYSILPVIHEASFCHRLNLQEPLPLEEKCLLVALCAMAIVKAPPASDLNFDAKKKICRRFLSHVYEIRKQSEWIESATLTSIITSYCLAVAHWEIKQYRSHCLYLREAVGLALEQELHLESTYTKKTHMQEICHRRTFALLFITERGLAILRNKPIMIARLPFLPTEHFDDEDPTILAGFQCICQLFALLDEKFVELWRQIAPEVDGTSSVVQNIASIQHDLNAISFETTGLSDIQKADVLVTQQWLRLIFWQASMRHGLVSSASQDPVFYYDYPIIIAKTLCKMMGKLPINAVIVHGSGIVSTVSHAGRPLC
jgi:Fungal Zn(2)-Cys(6) binuclear cluster domain/Fungal specific transcription factor domain